MTDEPDPDSKEIDPELWLQYLLGRMSNEGSREALVATLSSKTGLIPENIENMLNALLEILLRHTRSN